MPSVAVTAFAAVTALAFAALLYGCSEGGDSSRTFSQGGISFRYPKDWSVTGFSTSTFPRRLAVTSYRVPPGAVEGDCGGWNAVNRLPSQGAYVILIDYGQGSFPPRPRHLTMRDGKSANYECFGQSTMFRFRVGTQDIQAHVGLGPASTDQTRGRALAVLTTLAAVKD